MTIIRPFRPTDQSQPVRSSELEGQIREVIRRDVASAREPQADGDSEIGASGVNALLQQIAGSTFNELDRLIEELRGLRHLLQSEGERVQREIVKYAHLSQAVMKSTKVIAEGMSQLQNRSETS